MLSKRVLVVGDRFHTDKILAVAGIIAKTVKHPGVLRAACADFKVHIVVVDLAWPFKSGFELCRSIRGFPTTETVLIINVSAYPSRIIDLNRLWERTLPS
jgi:DNA-binding response OmpR family regulator